MNWVTIKLALYAAAIKVDNGMTINQFDNFTKEVKQQLSHDYDGNDGTCINCGESYDYIFHTHVSA